MIFVTGDCHGDFSKFSTKNFPEQKEMTKNDYVIICGDFGGVFCETETEYEKRELDRLDKRPFTTLFVDGNHENFDRLYAMPVEEWHGGAVHKIRESVIHLMRGEIFNIDGRRFFAFGGARSHDISDGILDITDEEKIYAWSKRGLLFRIRGYDWWDLEMPTKEEMEHGLKTLESVNFNVDYVVSHCAPSGVVKMVSAYYKTDELTNYFQGIQNSVEFSASLKYWFFGHYHEDSFPEAHFVCLYDKIIRIA